MPIVSRLAKTGLRRGIFEGSRAWLVVGVAAGGVRLLGRFARREPEVVFTETVKPGHTLMITVRSPGDGNGPK